MSLGEKAVLEHPIILIRSSLRIFVRIILKSLGRHKKGLNSNKKQNTALVLIMVLSLDGSLDYVARL